LREVIVTFNLFENVDKPHPSEEELRTQRRWTRVYLVLLTVILIIVMLLTALTDQAKPITVDKPTLNDYKKFEERVDCPCTNLSIPYHIFIDLNVSFHDVCSSSFIDRGSNWTTMLYSAFSHKINTEDNSTTFQRMALSHFQALRAMCETATQTAKNELSLFLNSTFVSASVIDVDVFQKQINATLSDFKSNSMSSNFLHSLQLSRGIYSSNGFISAFGTNWSPVILKQQDQGKIYMRAQEYNLSSCNCATSPTCVQNMTLERSPLSLWSVPGMMSGCLPLDSMLESTLECMYDQACLDTISDTLNSSLRYIALIANRTRFHPINTFKLESIVTELFIEEWFSYVSFESYFNACQPESCSYTRFRKFDIFYILDTLIVVYGGLSIVLELTIPIVLKFIYKHLPKRRNRVVPINVS
jgi:hypothetical protein